jgi:hypothetical protein
MGRTTEAAAILRGAAAEADRSGLTASELRALNNLLGAVNDEDQRAAMALMQEGYQLALRTGNRPFVMQFLMLLANGSQATGDWGAWMGELDATEEGEVIFPFYGAAFASIRALLAAMRGDRAGAASHQARATAIAADLDSRMVTAATAATEAACAFYAAEWQTAARRGLDAGTDSNYAVEGPNIAADAAVAGDLAEELDQAVRMLRGAQSHGQMTLAALAAAEAGQAAREGRWDEARAGYRRALEVKHAAGDLLGEARTGLAWGMLAGDRDPEAAAAGTAAEQFFTERGGAAMVAAYRAAFVPVQEASAPAVRPANKARAAISSG